MVLLLQIIGPVLTDRTSSALLRTGSALWDPGMGNRSGHAARVACGEEAVWVAMAESGIGPKGPLRPPDRLSRCEATSRPWTRSSVRNSLGAGWQSSGRAAPGQRRWAPPGVDGISHSPGVTGDRVALRIPAVSAYLLVLRTATSGLAARMDFSLDEIEDLRIAVDEACVMLLSAALPGADLEVEFALTGDALAVSVTVRTLTGAQPAKDTFAWTVLCALADSVESHVGLDDRVTIRLGKKRAAAGSGGEAP